MKNLKEKLEKSSDAQLDGVWIILRSNVGILRKLKVIAELLQIAVESLTKDLPKDENGFILDRESREIIHKILLPESKKRKK